MAQGHQIASVRTVTDRVPVPGAGAVSAVSVVVEHPADFRAGVTPALVLAPGAGSRLEHPFLANLSAALAPELLVLRFNFPYQEARRSSPDPAPRLEATYRAVLAWLRAHPSLAPGPLFAGGKSMGGRMTSQAQSERPLADVRGLVFVGFPLHPVGDPGTARADHLHRIAEPMLFLQGTKDRLANPDLLKPVLARLGDRAHVEWLDDGDHDFKVPVRGGMTRAETLDWIAERTLVWMRKAI